MFLSFLGNGNNVNFMIDPFEIKFNLLIAHQATKTSEGWITKCNRKFKYMDEPTSKLVHVDYKCKDCFNI
jgi:hypothetical protein